jgi:hypothetical protein
MISGRRQEHGNGFALIILPALNESAYLGATLDGARVTCLPCPLPFRNPATLRLLQRR